LNKLSPSAIKAEAELLKQEKTKIAALFRKVSKPGSSTASYGMSKSEMAKRIASSDAFKIAQLVGKRKPSFQNKEAITSYSPDTGELPPSRFAKELQARALQKLSGGPSVEYQMGGMGMGMPIPSKLNRKGEAKVRYRKSDGKNFTMGEFSSIELDAVGQNGIDQNHMGAYDDENENGEADPLNISDSSVRWRSKLSSQRMTIDELAGGGKVLKRLQVKPIEAFEKHSTWHRDRITGARTGTGGAGKLTGIDAARYRRIISKRALLLESNDGPASTSSFTEPGNMQAQAQVHAVLSKVQLQPTVMPRRRGRTTTNTYTPRTESADA